jgi:hypothetical protein
VDWRERSSSAWRSGMGEVPVVEVRMKVLL